MTTRAYAAVHETFDKRLLHACRRVSDNPAGTPDGLFIALPERLLSKCAYLCLGKTRPPQQEPDDSKPTGITPEMEACLLEYDREGHGSLFANLDLSNRAGNLKHVLLCHALSPIEDSVLLLADIGRAHRVARIMAVDMRVMLSDISWMSSNRSIRQFPTLTEDTIDTGLRVCLDKRTRLYEALGIQPDRHEIVPYDTSHKISGKKLSHISARYRELAASLWGDAVGGRLDRELVRRICQSLDVLPRLQEAEGIDGLPAHIYALGQFPGVLVALEDILKPHLELLRLIAKQFTSFDEEIFSYFFAQYYAQAPYRGSVIKVAPISERAFDEPFDKLDAYFRAWGDGHSTAEVTAGSHRTDHQVTPLAAAYAPQYSIGSLAVLPYTPLSLTALRQEPRDHHLIADRLMMLEDLDRVGVPEHIKKNRALLEITPTARRNRLMGDVASFIVLCMFRGYRDELNAASGRCGYSSIEDVLSHVAERLPASLERELGARDAADVESLWLTTWLENVQIVAQPEYMPVHMWFYLCDDSDWTPGVLNACAGLTAVAQLMYKVLT